MAAPVIVGTLTSAWSASATTTITIAKPSGVQDGDYLVAFLRDQSAGATADWTSSGWARLSFAFQASSTTSRLMGIYGLAVPSAAALTATSFTFSFTGSTGRAIGAIAIVRGVDLSAPVVATSASYGGTNISLGSRIDTYTDSAGANSLALGMFSNEIVAGTTNTVTVTSTATITTLYSNDTANDGTTGTTGSRTTLAVMSYPGTVTLPYVDVQWGTIAGNGAEGIVLKGVSAISTVSFTHSEAGVTTSVTSTSTDSNGTITSYDWDWGDGATHGTTATTTHTYASSGTYAVTLIVTDNSGGTGTTTQTITIGGATIPPTRKGYTFTNPATTSTTAILDPSVITAGSAISTGDWMIVVVVATSTHVVTPPAGWMTLRAITLIGTLKYAVYGKIRTSGETTYIFTLDSDGSTSGATLLWGAGADTTVAHWTIGANTNRSVDLHNTGASLTTTVDHSLVLGISVERTTATESAITSVTGATEWLFMPQVGATQIETIDVAYIADQTPAGATPTIDWTYPNTQAINGMAMQIAIPPPLVVVNSVGYPGILRVGTTNYTGKLFYWDSSAAHDFTTIPIVRFSPVTVTQLLSPAHSPWFGAHRGFSYSYPEETLYSYRGATDWGIHAIEISVQKSQDGTFWCFHDPTTTRTTGVTGTISSMTDAVIAGLTNLGSTAAGNASQPAQPTAKLVDVLNLYAATHVIIIEDKTYANTTALLNLMDSYGTSGRPASDIFIWKADAMAGSGFYTAPAARGYHRWGYIFDADMASSYASIVASGKMDMIGMDFHSSDATLSAAIALAISNNVRPTGHIIASIAQRDRLLGLGMTGLIVSNKDVVPPWYTTWGGFN